MPEFIVRQVREARIEADDIETANYVGAAVLTGDPSREDLGGSENWNVLEEPSVKVFVVEED